MGDNGALRAVVVLVGLLLPNCSHRSINEITAAGGVRMVQVPAGWFTMGSARGEVDEVLHKVWISSFVVDKFEVTQSEYQRVMGCNPSKWKGNTSNPVEQVRWSDAARYCNTRSESEGLSRCYDLRTWECSFDANGYRLPTEAEWEYMARAGAPTEYFFGEKLENLMTWAWFANNSSRRPHAVGQKPPNPWGLCDIYGNVAEWCNDYYDAEYYHASPDSNPPGPQTGSNRLLRGGSWKADASECRSAFRQSDDPGYTDPCFGYDTYGFRTVKKSSITLDNNKK